ncbi:MAG: amidohydrolase family protein [Christensenellales bacterium]|jgi:predicted TIM-barrel fold metal-dependent hydrolase
MVIDFHTHCFPDAVAKKAIPELEESGCVKALHDGTVGSLKQLMDECDVDISIVLPVATKPSQVPVINDWAKSSADDTLCFFGALHPDDPYFYENAKKLKEDGFRGVKLHPDYQHFYADEPRMMPLYEALRDLGLIVSLHSGMDIGYPVPVHCTPLMIKNIMESIKGLKIIAAHMGAYALWQDVEALLIGLPIFFDTSYSYHALKQQGMERIIKKHGAENVLFGTDSPWKRADTEISRIIALNLPARDIDKILFGNALSLLN